LDIWVIPLLLECILLHTCLFITCYQKLIDTFAVSAPPFNYSVTCSSRGFCVFNLC